MRKNFKLQILSTILVILILVGCKKEDKDSMAIFQPLLNNSWTEKTGIFNGVYLGNGKTFYKMSFQNDGNCNIIWVFWGDTISQPAWKFDTTFTKYRFENNSVLFPDPIGSVTVNWGQNPDTLQLYFISYQILSFENNTFHMKGKEGNESNAFYTGPSEMYLEPIE